MFVQIAIGTVLTLLTMPFPRISSCAAEVPPVRITQRAAIRGK